MIGAIQSLNDFPAMSALNAPIPLSSVASDAKITQSAQDFEAMFATQMLQPMFETVEVDKTFGGGHGEEVMRSFMMQEYGKTIAKSGKLGIASQVKAEMLRIQEQARSGKASPATAQKAQSAYQGYSNQGAVNVAAR